MERVVFEEFAPKNVQITVQWQKNQNNDELNNNTASNNTSNLARTVIEVKPYISQLEELDLITGYLKKCFSPQESDFMTGIHETIYLSCKNNYWSAEDFLIGRIIVNNTNIDITDENTREAVFSWGIFEQVISNIKNYNSFRKRLDAIVEKFEQKRALDKSLGSVIESLSGKVSDWLDALQSLDIDRLSNVGKDLVSSIEQSPMSEIFKEASRQNSTIEKPEDKEIEEVKPNKTSKVKKEKVVK